MIMIPEIILYIGSILLGLAVGSFLNVVVLRGEKNKPCTGRSHCMHCKKQLCWYELIPLVSFLVQKGKCRSCKKRLSLQYPLVEATTALVFLVVLWHCTTLSTPLFSVYGMARLFVHGAMWSVLIAITAFDLRTKTIPDLFNLCFAGFAFLGLALSWIHTNPSFSEVLLALSAGPLLFLPFYLLWKVSQGRWIGLGDGKFAWGMGWFLGLGLGFSAVLYAFWIGTVVSLLAMAGERLFMQKHKKDTLTFSSEIPFAPFLVLGTACAYLSGTTVLALFSSIPFLW